MRTSYVRSEGKLLPGTLALSLTSSGRRLNEVHTDRVRSH